MPQRPRKLAAPPLQTLLKAVSTPMQTFAKVASTPVQTFANVASTLLQTFAALASFLIYYIRFELYRFQKDLIIILLLLVLSGPL